MLRPAHAAGTGPTINVSGPAATVAAGAAIRLNFTTSAVTDQYGGYQIALQYDSSKVLLNSNGPADDSRQSLAWNNRSCTSSWDQTAGSPMKKLYLNCAGASTPSQGLIAHVDFTAIGTGGAVFHMLSVGPPDNAGTAWGTYTTDADNNQQNNTLTCSAGHCGPLPWLPGSQAWDVVVDIAPPDVTLTKAASTNSTAATPTAANGQAEDFTLTARNTSTTTTATGVVFTDTVPSMFTVTGTSDATNCAVAGQAVTCTYASLGSSASQVVVIHTTTGTWPDQSVTSGQSAQNCATVTLNEADPNTANNSDCKTVGNGNPPDVSLSGTTSTWFGKSNPAPYTHTALVKGDSFSYNIVVQNQQPYLNATNVHVTVPIPSGIALPLATMPSTCTLNTGNRTVDCSVGTLAPQASVALALWMAVDIYVTPPLTVNSPCFTATLTEPDPNLSNNSGCDTSSLQVAVDLDGDGYSDAEEIALGKNPNVSCAIMRADVNHDGTVTIGDLAVVAGFNGKTVPPAPGRYDQNADGVINNLDLNAVSAAYLHSVSECP